MNTSLRALQLPALQGSSLLGFMAALGTLKTLTTVLEMGDVKLKWIPFGSSFCPVVTVPGDKNDEMVLEILNRSLRLAADHPSLTIDKDLKISGPTFRRFSQEMVSSYLEKHDVFGVSMAAAFGCDAIVNDEGTIEDTAFRTMSGAGHQHFLEFMNVLAKETTIDHLREALFGPWLYRDPSPIMRWDAEDDRRYALRWDEPSKDPVRTVRGANRLAIAALPMFSVVPVSSQGLATKGFRGRKSNDTFVTWPLWSNWLTTDAVSTLLGISELQWNESVSTALASRGVRAVFRSQRITLGKYRNFTPARAL